MIRNVIFDWSGTLVDDLPAVWEATNHVFDQAGIESLSLERFRAEFRLPFSGFYERYTPHVPMKQLEAWFHGRYRELQDSVVALRDAEPFLVFCRENGLRTLVLSSLHPEHFERQSTRTGLAGYFDRSYVGVLDKRAKIHEILLENAFSPGETLFVGDMEHDIETARHGGVRSCAVLTGYQTLPELRSAGPDWIVEHLGELRDLLTGEFAGGMMPGVGRAMEKHPVVTVGALIFDGEGRLLLIRTPKWSDLWGMPGGKVKYGERIEDAVIREVKEETNLDLEEVRFVSVEDCIQPEEFYREAHFVLLNFRCRAIHSDVRLNDEGVAHCWVRPEAALEMRMNTPTRALVQQVLGGGGKDQ